MCILTNNMVQFYYFISIFKEVIEIIYFVSHKGGAIIVNDLRSCINATIMGHVAWNSNYWECEPDSSEFITLSSTWDISDFYYDDIQYLRRYYIHNLRFTLLCKWTRIVVTLAHNWLSVIGWQRWRSVGSLIVNKTIWQPAKSIIFDCQNRADDVVKRSFYSVPEYR